LICSAAAPPEELYPDGKGSEAFRRAVSRLMEMKSMEYLKRGHGVHNVGA
jgi:cell division protein ZapE